VNTQAAADVVDCSNPKNSKYYVVVVQVRFQISLHCHEIKFTIYILRICISLQYMARLNAENIKNFLYELNEKKIPKKRFNSKILYNLLKIFFLIIVSDILYYAPLAFV
jgi:hypothetical protein